MVKDNEVQQASNDIELAYRSSKSQNRFFLKKTFFSLLKDRKLIITLHVGQFLSFMITCSGLCTEMLNRKYELELPGLQTFFTYFLIYLVFFPYYFLTMVVDYYKRRDCRWGFPLFLNKRTGYDPQKSLNVIVVVEWKKTVLELFYYFIVALFDYQGNFLVVCSIPHISILNMTLLLSLTTPIVMIFSMVFLRFRYKIFHYIGVAAALGGIGLLFIAPEKGLASSPDGGNLWMGCCMCLSGALCYACSNLCQEALVKRNGIMPFLAMIGLNGTIISVIQNIVILNQTEMYRQFFSFSYPCGAMGFIGLYGLSLILFYSLTPWFLSRSNATLFNLSLLTNNLYTLILFLVIFEHTISLVYIAAFVMVMLGLLVFNLASSSSPSPLLPSSSSSPPSLSFSSSS